MTGVQTCALPICYVEEAVKAIAQMKEYGIGTMVDATPCDAGRDPLMFKEIAERAEFNIICISGFFKDSMGGAAHLKFRKGAGTAEDEVYEIFCKELEQGIGDTGVRPGMLKIATDMEINDYQLLLIQAAARAAKDMNVNIITHTESGRHGSTQAKLLLEAGVNPKHVMIGHLNNVTDYLELAKIYRQGVYGAFDRWGLGDAWVESTEDDQLAIFCSVMGGGFGKQVMFSQDADLWLRGTPMPAEFKSPWNHIPTYVIPQLLSRGITQEQIDDIMINNPREFLCGD